MRVLVLAEAIGGLRAGLAGAAVGRAWAARGHQVAVVPLAAAGAGLGDAVADLTGPGAAIRVVGEPGGGPSSAGVGDALARALAAGVDEVWLDLASATASDLGEGLLRALGGTGGAVDAELVAAARARLGRTRLVGVVAADQTGAELTGLRGVASLNAAAARDAGEPVPAIGDLLALDVSHAALAAAMGLPDPPTGAGAAGGLGLAVLALGGSLASACGAVAGLAGLERTLRRADLVVVVADAIDFGDAGGEVVSAARAWAESACVPCVALAESMRISARELRQLGIEAAYGLRAGERATEQTLQDLAGRVSSTWTWPEGDPAGRDGVSPHVH